MIPSRRTIVTVVVSIVVGGVMAIGASTWLAPSSGPASGPQPPYDPRFVPVGRAYLTELGKAYAEAWDEGAKDLEAGQGLAPALAAVAKAWEQNRVQLFDRMVTPEFDRLIPETKKETEVTPQERAAMAAAWRGFALGLAR
jgi:hypothetical protein